MVTRRRRPFDILCAGELAELKIGTFGPLPDMVDKQLIYSDL